jgi:hypothetical protein
MERRRAFLLVAGIAAALIATGVAVGALAGVGPFGDPYESSYTTTVERVDDPTTVENDSVIDYENLSDTQQRQFEAALAGRLVTESQPALEPSSYVRYDGTVYVVLVATA